MQAIGRAPAVGEEQEAERDTPIFVGQAMSLRAALDRLDGAAVGVRA